jgi:argininosuccinate lyase
MSIYARRLGALSAIAVMLLGSTPSFAQEAPRDAFYWLSEMNKASTVMVVEQGIVPAELGSVIADSVAQVIKDQSAEGAARSGDYLQVEPLLIAVGGPDVTRMHSGRSRQDIGSTSERLFQREAALKLFAALIKTRQAMLDLAATNPDAIVPAYTVGVQAQPITFGHFITAYVQALDRAAERLKVVYGEINMSPLGSGALGTSSFPVDRERLAELLGFGGALENSLDANQLSRIDTGGVVVGVANAMALTVGTLLSDIEAQYRFTSPWLILKDGTTGTSSIMPQKRNPNSVNTARGNASAVLAQSTAFYFGAHNLPHGLRDQGNSATQTLEAAEKMLTSLASLMGDLEFRAEVALAEVNADYSTSTELADVLQREADVPFRVGHHFASLLVTYGRSNQLTPAELPFAEAERIYAEAAEEYELDNKSLPLTEERFREALSPQGMVNASLGLGGPQPSEVARMMSEQLAGLDADADWLADQRTALAAASTSLDEAFNKLRSAAAN